MIPLQIPGYTLETRLGQGAFGVVYQAIWNEDFPCAVKVLEEGALHRGYLGMVLEELLELPPHEGLLPVYAFDLEEVQPHLSMALLPGGAVTFDDLAGQLTREEAWALLRQLADALAWLHDHGLVHAGLTGGNVFVMAEEDGTPRALLTDVGQAWLGDGSMERLHDQAPYVPPERWLDPGRVLQDGHAETWDVYAFGVLAWRLLHGRWPRANQLFDRVLASKGETLTIDPPAFAEWLAEEPAPVWSSGDRDAAGASARAMVLRCLALDPAERPASMAEVTRVLQEMASLHPMADEAAPAGLVTAPGMLPVTLPGRTEAFPAVITEGLPEAIAMPLPGSGRVGAVEQSARIPVGGKPDFSEVFAAVGPEPGARAKTAPVLEEPAGSGAKSSPGEEADPPVAGITSLRSGQGAGRRLAVAAVVLLGAGSLVFALRERGKAERLDARWQEVASELSKVKADAAASAVKAAALETERATREVARLAQVRDEWAGFTAALLQTCPSEPAALEAWKPAAAPVAERLKAALHATETEPSLLAGSMEPGWQLAELYRALGQSGEALPWLEHLSRDLQMEAAGGPPPDDARRLLGIRTGSRRGAILLEQRRTMEAEPLLTTASQAYEAWLGEHPDRHEVAREFAVNSLWEGRALIDRQQPEAARTALSRVAGLLGQPGEAGFVPEDHFTLTDALFELAGLDSTGGKSEQAIEQHMQAIRLLVSYDEENRRSVLCRRRLADGYFGLGRLLTKTGTPRDASVAFSETVKLLNELSTESPAEPSYRLQLALTFNEVAQLIRVSRPNVPGAKEALEYQNGSVTILRNLNEANTLDNHYRHQLAAALVLNGELQEAAGDSKNGLSRHTEGLALLEELLAEPTLPETDRRECRRLSARAWTAMGGIQEKAGSKDEAIASLSKALEAWSGFAGDDPAADRIVASTRERLRKLKPES